MTLKKSNSTQTNPTPLLKNAEQMSRLSGIGENKLREMMENREIEFVQNGNRRLLADQAICDWYNRNKTPVVIPQPVKAISPERYRGEAR